MSTQVSRTITLYASKGGKKEKVETDATTWGELKILARDLGYDVDKLLCTENVTRKDLVHDAAILPEDPFTLFMRPAQVKSGSRDVSLLAYRDIKAGIKEDIDTYGEIARIHYNRDKNYTVKPTQELRELLGSFVASEVISENLVMEIAEEIVEEEEVEEIVEEEEVLTSLEALETAKDLLFHIEENEASQDVSERIGEILSDIFPGLKASIIANMEKTSDVIEDVVTAEDGETEEELDEEARLAEEVRLEKVAEKARLEKEENEALAKESLDFI